MRISAQPVPAAPFGDRRVLLLPPATNGNQHSKPASWLTPSRQSEDFLDMEGDNQGGDIPADDPAESFGDWHLPLLPPPTNGNRHSKLAPWLTPLRLSEDFLNTEGEDQ